MFSIIKCDYHPQSLTAAHKQRFVTTLEGSISILALLLCHEEAVTRHANYTGYLCTKNNESRDILTKLHSAELQSCGL